MSLSISQKEYLDAIHNLSITGATLTTVAEKLDYAKPTVHVALRKLVEEGYIFRNSEDNQNFYFLTPKGKDVISNLERKKVVMMDLFADHLELNPKIFTKKINSVCELVPDEWVDAIEYKLKEDEKHPEDLIPKYLQRDRNIEFRLVKKDKGLKGPTSMGNKGFEHPCYLSSNNQGKYITLTSKKIYYNSKVFDKRLRGQLKDLYYLDQGKYDKAYQGQDGVFSIPISAVKFDKSSIGITGKLRIKAVSSAKIMKVAEADMYMQFSEY